MSPQRGASDELRLRDVVERARHDLRGWTDRDESDPGVALLELLALVAELLASRPGRIEAETYHGGTGRWLVDPVGAPASPRAAEGLHRAVVLDTADPLVQQRLLVRIPGAGEDHSAWAAACLPVPGGGELPSIGERVWVAFESGDPERPVWMGRRVTD